MSCEEALQKLNGPEKPNVVIQDLFMRHGDIDKLFRGETLKAFEVIGQAAMHHVPCVVLSNVGRLGKDQSAEEFQAGLMSRTGASAYVTKDEYDETEGRVLVGTLERLLTADKQ
jgi:CheY-like chemotaxis protein